MPNKGFSLVVAVHTISASFRSVIFPGLTILLYSLQNFSVFSTELPIINIDDKSLTHEMASI